MCDPGCGRQGQSGPKGRQDMCNPCCHTQRSCCRETLPSTHSDSMVEGMVGHGHRAPCSVLGPSIPLTPGDTPVRKKEEVLFDEEDDIMATLGFADSPTAERRQAGDQ